MAKPSWHSPSGFAEARKFCSVQFAGTDLLVHSGSPIPMAYGHLQSSDTASILGLLFRSAAILVAVVDPDTGIFHTVYYPGVAGLATVQAFKNE